MGKEKNNDDESVFWIEHHSWGDFPFDKPQLGISSTRVFVKNYKKKENNVEKGIKQFGDFVKEMFSTSHNSKRMRYPLL